MRPAANVYIDGFNLYNGLKRRAEAKGLDSPEYRWLNLYKLAEFLLPEYEVATVRYFTSKVKRRPADMTAGQRQQIFLRALATLPTLTVHYGYFQKNKVARHLVEDPEKVVRVIDYKEKGSDVNLASLLLADAFRRECKAAAVISDDSDLALPISIAKAELEHGVTLLNPNVTSKPARKLRGIATAYRSISESAFAACLFPDSLTDSKGTITKPDGW
jgi:NYN domain